jgi:hypothetical protein
MQSSLPPNPPQEMPAAARSGQKKRQPREAGEFTGQGEK